MNELGGFSESLSELQCLIVWDWRLLGSVSGMCVRITLWSSTARVMDRPNQLGVLLDFFLRPGGSQVIAREYHHTYHDSRSNSFNPSGCRVAKMHVYSRLESVRLLSQR
jgi:hypothetical protein